MIRTHVHSQLQTIRYIYHQKWFKGRTSMKFLNPPELVTNLERA
uniref:Uncharacterized protein n=1 Tax=Rhizophora mucronata TaxID=61149 RepID=A0A2P2JAF5_RHIMU